MKYSRAEKRSTTYKDISEIAKFPALAKLDSKNVFNGTSQRDILQKSLWTDQQISVHTCRTRYSLSSMPCLHTIRACSCTTNFSIFLKKPYKFHSSFKYQTLALSFVQQSLRCITIGLSFLDGPLMTSFKALDQVCLPRSRGRTCHFIHNRHHVCYILPLSWYVPYKSTSLVLYLDLSIPNLWF